MLYSAETAKCVITLCPMLSHHHTRTHTHTRLMALCPELPGWAGTRNVKPIWILLKQETVSVISWDIMQVCTSLQADHYASTPPLSFFTGRMPFLPPNQQCQSTEGNSVKYIN